MLIQALIINAPCAYLKINSYFSYLEKEKALEDKVSELQTKLQRAAKDNHELSKQDRKLKVQIHELKEQKYMPSQPTIYEQQVEVSLHFSFLLQKFNSKFQDLEQLCCNPNLFGYIIARQIIYYSYASSL